MVLIRLKVCSSLGVSCHLSTITFTGDRCCGRATGRSFLGPLVWIKHPRVARVSLRDSSLGFRFCKMQKAKEHVQISRGGDKMAAFELCQRSEQQRKEKQMLAVGGHGETMLLSPLKSLCSVWFLNLLSTPESFCCYVQSYQGSWGKKGKKIN